MKLLALETSQRAGGVALWHAAGGVEGDGVVAEADYGTHTRHAAGLLPAVDRALAGVGWAAGDLTHVAVSHGPGSFTGLRIGVTAAKMLAAALGVAVVPVPSLRVIAEDAGLDEVTVTLDARKGRRFAQTFARRGNAMAATTDLLHVPVADLPTPNRLDDAQPRAATLARLAATGGFPTVDPLTLLPLYVRRPEPEEKRLAAGVPIR